MMRAPLFRCALAALLCVPLGACTTPFARVAGITVDNRVATGPVTGVTIVHEGEAAGTAQGARLVPGDTIRTDAATRVRLELRTGYEVYLEENTELAVLNPKLLLKLGKAFVRTVREGLESVREALRVDTQYVVAAPAGTAFLLEVRPDSSVRYIVTEGRVRIEWRPQSDTVSRPPPWPPVVYEAFEGGVVRPGSPPERTPRLSQDDVDRELAWVRDVERLTVAVVPDVVGTSVDEARALLERARLRVGSVSENLQEGGRGGIVLSQEHEEGARLQPDDAVDLVVSAVGVRVPRLDGAEERTAANRLRVAGLEVGGTSREKQRDRRPGTVLRTDPARGELVRSGSRVALVVAAPCTVPDLTGLTRQQALERLTAEVLSVGQIATIGDGGNVVSNQDPKARTPVTCGTAVGFTIGRLRD